MTVSTLSDEAGAWLEARLAQTPPDLAEAVHELLDPAVPLGPEAMVDRALAALERVADRPQTRAGALELLAADALLTYAFESAADPVLGGSAGRALRLARETGPRGELGRRSAGG